MSVHIWPAARDRRVWTGVAALLLAAVVAIGALSAGQAEARKATRDERPAMIDAWYRAIGDIDPPECRNTWVTRVSAYRERTGIIYANFRLRERRGCLLGNGYGILRRPTRTSDRWRVVFQGSGEPPCRLITNRMARELGLLPCEP